MELQERRERSSIQTFRGNCCRKLGHVQDRASNPKPPTQEKGPCNANNVSQGLFSGNKANKYQVDKDGLKQLKVEQLAQGLQSGPGNEMAGVEGRSELLIRLGHALENKEYFGEDGRPGNMLGMAAFHNPPPPPRDLR